MPRSFLTDSLSDTAISRLAALSTRGNKVLSKAIKWSHYGFTLLLLTFCLLNPAQASEPRTPVDDNEVLQILSASNDQDSAMLRQLRQSLDKTPDNIELASQLAKAYINKARTDSDSRYYGYAEAVLSPWWKIQKAPSEVLLLRATLKQHQHQYKAATADLKQLLKQQPRNTQAWLSLSTIQLVTGDYQFAQAGCSALARISSSWLASLCHSQVFSLTGNASRAYQLQRTLALQVQENQPALLQWVLGLSAETAWRLNKKDQAEQYFKTAISLSLRDAYLLRVYSDFLLSENRPTEVLGLLKGETRDNALLLRLAIAAKLSKKPGLTKQYQELLEARYREANLRANNLHERDEAVYLLAFNINPKKALRLALDNWAIQRESDDALILLKAAIANQSTRDIQTVRHWVNKNRLEDARIELLLSNTDGNDNA